MGRNNYFQFKQFRILQEKTAMKVNTDGVLLGAWTNACDVKTILDVGTGTGLIALMLAQRTNAFITAVEIEKNSATEAQFNVQNSPWGNRIKVINCSFQEYAKTTKPNRYDLIVSNPPFFSNSIKNSDPLLSVARHNHLLPFSDIIDGANKLLEKNGKLAVILPIVSAREFIEKAQKVKLHLQRKTDVKPFPDKKPNRCLMEFGFEQVVCQKSSMSVFNDNSKEYSEEFKLLTQDFYLKL